MRNEFIVEPFVGTDSVTFGMTPVEVAQFLGPPERTSKNILGERDEHRSLVSVRYSLESEKAIEFSFSPGVRLVLRGRDLFEERDVIGYLRSLDPCPYEWVGFVIFLALGIMESGFHDGDMAQRGFTSFERGRMDKFRSEFRLFSPENVG